MTEEELKSRLDQISTRWTLIRDAHGQQPDARTAALAALITQYSGAAVRYLCSTLHDADAADEVFQEFALRFVRGDFHRADPQQGHFRHYLKKVLIHLVFQYRKNNARGAAQPLVEQMVLVDEQTVAFADEDQQFLKCWRDELLQQAWDRLQTLQSESGHPYYSVLRLRVDLPDATSKQIADRLNEDKALGQSFNSAGIRKTMQRARERFSEFLLDAVRNSLEADTAEETERELIDLGLIDYCRAAIRRRAQGS